jgi:hypothetical protein
MDQNHRRQPRTWPVLMCCLATLTGVLATEVYTQPAAESSQWFGVPVPPPFEPHVSPVIVGDRGVAPAVVPQGEADFQELVGHALYGDLEEIVQFSHESRAEREVGTGQLWGRISGLASGQRTVAWAVDQFRLAGIESVQVQEFDQDEDASLWLPLSWEVRLLGDEAFGSGTTDLVLTTAMPLSPSAVPAQGLVAPLVHVGLRTAAELARIDVRGKVAVQHVTPQGHLVFERTPTVGRARALFERGALGVINVIDLPGNERARHFAGASYQPRRTLVFVASAGHHSPGLHGPRNFVRMNPGLAERARLVLNIEHVAQRNLSPARSLAADGYREFVADAGEAPIVAGVSNASPFLESLFRRGVERYGTNFVSGLSTMASGEGGGYRPLGVAVVTTMQAPPLYHTSGEVTEMISVPGLERMARFLAFFIKQVDQAPDELINP